MVKGATPKRVNLPNGRSFVARYEKVPRDRLPPNVTIKRRHKKDRSKKQTQTTGWKRSS